MFVRKAFTRALTLATVLSLLMTSVVFADDIYNTLDTSIDATTEASSVNVGGTGTVTLKVDQTGTGNNPADGKSGCNLTGNTKLVTSVSSSAPLKATVSPSSIDWTSCGQVTVVTVTGVSAGSATISLAQTYNNTGGTFNLAPATFTVNVTAVAPTDTTGPTITPSIIGTEGNNSWYTSNVTLSWAVSDAESAVSSSTGCGTTDITSDQGATTYTCTATSAGGTTSQSVTIKRDATKPTIDGIVNPVTPDGTNTWYKTAPTVTFTCGDATSGIASCLVDGGATNPVTLGESSTAQTVSGTATDRAGHSDTASVSGLKVDLSDPTNIAFTGGPAAESSHYFGSVPAAPTCTADDAISGFKSCVVSGYETGVGAHTMTATATDNAGRTATAQRTYTVLAWTPSGYYSPVDMTTATAIVWNTIKGGQTVPLKFELFAGQTEITSVDAIKSFQTQLVSCLMGTGATEDVIEIVSTGGTSLRYDSTGGQFIQNWKTPLTSNKCYSATVTFDDGSKITAYFKTK